MAELVTGHAGKAHATAEQAAGLNAGILGLDDYVLNVHDKLKITVVSANKVTIGTGELVMQGRHVSQGTPEDLIVTNGSQGQKRNDLIVCRYAKGSQNIESAKLVVVRGTPTTGTPTDPAVNTTSPLDRGTTYDMPLYRIPLDGITIGTPVALFNVLKPMSDVWDSLTQMPDIESGMFIGSTSVNGAVSIKWGRHSTAPFAVFVTYAPNNNDSVTNSFTPLIWSVGDSDFQARLRDDRSHAWGGAQPVRLYWLATWKR
ncbi:hypothetical protein MCC10084_1790 [Bifidobacterium longum subsp. longum]|uniref:hypothetical protein n=5 Tax=Bifidobacterium longum TaxID=216816 RepID=UPI00103FA138|nr:hypothetical protein [Bifidobacterium longum]TCF07194.1 hypothetical protein MCC10084_1790 [Bifidobacterium longum subsp. longum]